MIKSTLLDRCLIDGGRVEEVLSLGMHSYADTFIPKHLKSSSEPIYPLTCSLCQTCGHVQVGYLTDDKDRYGLYEYSYTSSNSEYAKSHWKEFYENACSYFKDKSIEKVLEIGSNDGYLIGQFSGDNRELVGVDPSSTVGEIAEQAGISVYYSLFNSELAQSMKEKYRSFDLIIANNVLNHSNTPVDFINGVEQLLDVGGLFIFEIPYWGDLINSKHFDQIYHEHVSYFTVRSILKLLEATKLDLIDASMNDYHGGSLRIVTRKRSGEKLDIPADVKAIVEREIREGLFTKKLYQEFWTEISLRKSKFLVDFHTKRVGNPNATFIGVGAAAKANTLLTFYGIGSDDLQFITDASSQKIGKYTPMTRIPILSDSAIVGIDHLYALILSWNISAEIRKQLISINPNVRFLEL